VTNPGEVTGYAVGLAHHTAKDGRIIWYGGGKLAADLTLPKLRRRWAGPAAERGTFPGRELPDAAVRGVLRGMVTTAAEQARDEAGFFAGLREAGVLVRLRFSEINPRQVTGYSVALPGHAGGAGTPLWHGGGRLSAGLTLPRLRCRWDPSRNTTEPGGAFRFTAAERDAIYGHAARQAAAAAEHIRRCAGHDPGQAADAAWAAADTLHAAARALDSRALRRAADSYDRAARARYGQIPLPTREGSQLRSTARLLALTGGISGDATMFSAALIASLVALAASVAELRQAQQHAAQAAAARAAAAHLHAATVRARSQAMHPGQAQTKRRQSATGADVARGDFPVPLRPSHTPSAGPGPPHPHPHRRPLPPRRAGPGR
jgi:hypothetical protein